MPRLPQPGGDQDVWGDILNNFLQVEHKADGTLKKAGDISKAKSDAAQALTDAAAAQSAANNAVQSVSAGANVSVDNSDPQNPIISASGVGGATDHGALTGLGDDDHPQYHTDARGDARYYTQSQIDTSLSGKSDTGHSHDGRYYTEAELDAGQLDNRYYTEGEVDTALSGKSDTTHNHDGDYATSTHNHDASYATAAQGSLADTSVQPGDNVSDLVNDANYATQTELSTHAGDTTSVHGIADTSALETQSGAQTKANTAESNANSYTDSEIAGLDVGNATQIQSRAVAATAPTDGQALVWNDTGSTWQPGDASGGASYIEGDGIAKVTVATTAPTSPNVGDIWVQT